MDINTISSQERDSQEERCKQIINNLTDQSLMKLFQKFLYNILKQKNHYSNFKHFKEIMEKDITYYLDYRRKIFELHYGEESKKISPLDIDLEADTPEWLGFEEDELVRIESQYSHLIMYEMTNTYMNPPSKCEYDFDNVTGEIKDTIPTILYPIWR